MQKNCIIRLEHMRSLYFTDQFHNMRLTNKKTLHPHGTWNVRLNELLRSIIHLYTINRINYQFNH